MATLVVSEEELDSAEGWKADLAADVGSMKRVGGGGLEEGANSWREGRNLVRWSRRKGKERRRPGSEDWEVAGTPLMLTIGSGLW